MITNKDSGVISEIESSEDFQTKLMTFALANFAAVVVLFCFQAFHRPFAVASGVFVCPNVIVANVKINAIVIIFLIALSPLE